MARINDTKKYQHSETKNDWIKKDRIVTDSLYFPNITEINGDNPDEKEKRNSFPKTYFSNYSRNELLDIINLMSNPYSEILNNVANTRNNTSLFPRKRLTHLTDVDKYFKTLHALDKNMNKSVILQKKANSLSSSKMINMYKHIEEILNKSYIMPSLDGTEHEFVLIASGDVVDDDEPSFT